MFVCKHSPTPKYNVVILSYTKPSLTYMTFTSCHTYKFKCHYRHALFISCVHNAYRIIQI